MKSEGKEILEKKAKIGPFVNQNPKLQILLLLNKQALSVIQYHCLIPVSNEVYFEFVKDRNMSEM